MRQIRFNIHLTSQTIIIDQENSINNPWSGISWPISTKVFNRYFTAMFYARFEINFPFSIGNSKPFGPERITSCTAVPKLLVWTQRQGCHRSMVKWYVAVSHVCWTVPCHPHLKVMKEIDEALHQKVQT